MEVALLQSGIGNVLFRDAVLVQGIIPQKDGVIRGDGDLPGPVGGGEIKFLLRDVPDRQGILALAHRLEAHAAEFLSRCVFDPIDLMILPTEGGVLAEMDLAQPLLQPGLLLLVAEDAGVDLLQGAAGGLRRRFPQGALVLLHDVFGLGGLIGVEEILQLVKTDPAQDQQDPDIDEKKQTETAFTLFGLSGSVLSHCRSSLPSAR